MAGAVVSPESLRGWLARTDLTIEDLVEQANALLPAIAPKQIRYKVTERPDVRTVRYYISESLLPKSIGYDGGRARYTGSHLLRLLLIKRMQAEHHTLGRIAQTLRGASDEQVIHELLASVPEASERANDLPAPRRLALAPRRLALAPGGVLELPDELLDDPKRRADLADNLEVLARWLRAGVLVKDQGGEQS